MVTQAALTDCEVVATGTAGLGRLLRGWRALRRIKQGHAAVLLGVSQPTVSRWENGVLAPTPDQEARLRALLAARPDGAADRELIRLVSASRQTVHLVCDLTHRLLAVSGPRAREWRVDERELVGVSLWRYASDDIRAAEARLGELGWFAPAAPAVTVTTNANRSREVPIHPGRCEWVRFPLSDGSFARLVRTVPAEPVGTAVDARC
ncbi:helix-turn-helix transcriptional regulator [Xanthobacteraceae bacterium Astr-EGSB]|uniref:helix-turn-helix domain-containing protein n=1 Tax=Astrobacterium formosum TaxID=3069710 RepID=UPI0027B56610|nr:helix-turn-helix transcriptional regulator [Xanthobacteraceae bacterium Astr-EGSB]